MFPKAQMFDKANMINEGEIKYIYKIAFDSI
jgi:hypothetical protein